MRKILLALVAIGAMAAIVLLAGRGCSRSQGGPAPVDATPAARARADVAVANDPASPGDTADLATRRLADMQDAVSVLHRYLAALGSGDDVASASYWSGGVVPRVSGEADLRTRGPLRSLRSKTGMPTPLDASPLPDALEVPVELRAAVDGSTMLLYSGSYRLRRRVADGGWEITSAAVTVRTP